MSVSQERWLAWLATASDLDKICFLARLSHELTVDGRWVVHYLVGEKQRKALNGLNELQHQISQNIVHLAETTNRYSGEQLWDILQSNAVRFGVAHYLKRALDFLESRRTSTNPTN